MGSAGTMQGGGSGNADTPWLYGQRAITLAYDPSGGKDFGGDARDRCCGAPHYWTRCQDQGSTCASFTLLVVFTTRRQACLGPPPNSPAMLPTGDALRKAALADQRRALSATPSNLSVSTANLGAYDNKVVASSLGGGSELGSAVGGSSPISAVFSRPPAISGASGGPGSSRHDEGRPSISSSSAAALLRPNLNLGSSTTLATSSGATNRPLLAGADNSTHPSHPSSPWSHCSMYVLALFNGTPLPLPFEDLKWVACAAI